MAMLMQVSNGRRRGDDLVCRGVAVNPSPDTPTAATPPEECWLNALREGSLCDIVTLTWGDRSNFLGVAGDVSGRKSDRRID